MGWPEIIAIIKAGFSIPAKKILDWIKKRWEREREGYKAFKREVRIKKEGENMDREIRRNNSEEAVRAMEVFANSVLEKTNEKLFGKGD